MICDFNVSLKGREGIHGGRWSQEKMIVSVYRVSWFLTGNCQYIVLIDERKILYVNEYSWYNGGDLYSIVTDVETRQSNFANL